jgi:hypothetical protein
MQERFLLPLAIAIAGALAAQSNTVPGLDGRLTNNDGPTLLGRRGAAFPNGEIGMSYSYTMCNAGSAPIPWTAAMDPGHPMFAFMVVRESNGRMEQITNSATTYVKHAFGAANSASICGTCQSTGSGLRVGCSDTYGAGTNGSPFFLGPPSEIDPWTGIWNPVGSYFDRGDPDVGAPGNTDGVRSLSSAQVSAFDGVKNRVTLREQDLLVPGRLFYCMHIVCRGEAGNLVFDNVGHRQMSATANAGAWTFANTGVPFTQGSPLAEWTGASVASARNGNDDGWFFVAVKVTDNGNGTWHYEYAVENFDNARGGASLHVPMLTTANVTNIGFRDVDQNVLNDWTWNRTASELVFTAAATNALDWNTIYNFWFDCDVAPSNGQVQIDEARIGPGNLTVAVGSRVPSGIPTADVTTVGTGCGACPSSFYEFFGTAAGFDLANSSMALVYNSGSYHVTTSAAAYVAPTGTNLNLTDDSETTVLLPFTLPYPGGSTPTLQICSNGFISPGIGNGTAFTPDVSSFLAGTQPRWAACWHDLLPGAANNVYFDVSPAVVRVTWLNVPNYSGGGANTFQYQFLPNGTIHVLWQAMSAVGNAYVVGYTPGGGAVDPGARDLSAALPAGFDQCGINRPALTLAAGSMPVLGTTVSLTTSNVPPGSPFGGTIVSFAAAVPPTDLASIGMPGCQAYLIGGNTWLVSAPGASFALALGIPLDNSYIGTSVVAQSCTLSPPLTPLGAISSNGVRLLLGL